MFEGVSSSDGDVDCYGIIIKLVLFSTYGGHQNRHTGVATKHTGNFFCKISYSRYDVTSEVFQTNRNGSDDCGSHIEQNNLSENDYSTFTFPH
jgi:hypothetical protein